MRGHGRNIIISIAVISATIFLIACGVKSPPIPPGEAVPERIVGLNAVSEKNGVLLSWERPENTAGGHKMRDLGSFEVERAESTVEFRPLVQIPITDQDRFQQQHGFTYLDTTAQIGHHYRYQVISQTQDLYRSQPSNEAEITRELPAPPPNPENFVVPQPTPLP